MKEEMEKSLTSRKSDDLKFSIISKSPSSLWKKMSMAYHAVFNDDAFK